ncbi:MAG TPA: hypothetical protein VMF30_13185 [Pirellulales bacterium]|nr:hypothetical protein [Pirellulales bacterium]
MSDHGKNHHHGQGHGEHGHQHGEHGYLEHGRKAWRWHRDWRVYVVVILMLAGMFAYVMSLDESLRPGQPPQQEMPAAP